jgi:hypothetical protein
MLSPSQYLQKSECLHPNLYERLYNQLNDVGKKYAMDCPYCGKVFATNNKRRVTCSARCQYAMKNQTQKITQCAWCGVEFFHQRITAKYCSNTCRQRAHRLRTRYTRPTRKHPKKTCSHCRKSKRIYEYSRNKQGGRYRQCDTCRNILETARQAHRDDLRADR